MSERSQQSRYQEVSGSIKKVQCTSGMLFDHRIELKGQFESVGIAPQSEEDEQECTYL